MIRHITWDWRHDFCHKACRLTNHGYEKASFTPVPGGIRHERKIPVTLSDICRLVDCETKKPPD
ncbi:MAG: hypothetical protein CI948_2326 [Halanaerobium sp.]|jgi:hypothetical protein|nr:MAG: hypothetical protein CI948_2326 [Halanaerobium sp.]